LEISDGEASLKNVTFRDGTIASNVRPLADGMPGIQFRRQSPDSMGLAKDSEATIVSATAFP